MNRLRRCLKNSRGQSLVEFALVLPVLILLLCGIIEFGRVFNQQLVVTAAAREGARVAAVGKNDATVTATVQNYAATINEGSLTVSINPAARPSGTAVKVTVINPVEIITPLIGAFFPANPYPVTGSSTMIVE